MNIAFFMQPKSRVAYINSNDTVRNAIEKLRHNNYMTMPVIDEEQKFVTIISQGDLLFQYGTLDTLKDLENKYIRDIKPRREIYTATISTDMEQLVEICMVQNFVPVVDDRNFFIGIITRKSIIKYYIKESKTQYQKGVMDTFGEMVKAGIKRIALAHPFDNKEERDSYIPFVRKMCNQYGISYYLDDDPLITDLFEKHLNYGTYNIIFYKNEEDIREYNELKKYKHTRDYNEIRYEVAYRFGKLLSYSDETINNYIKNNHEKE